MTSPCSSDSLIPSPPDRSEAEARIERALKVIRDELSFTERLSGLARAVSAYGALLQVRNILDGGQS